MLHRKNAHRFLDRLPRTGRLRMTSMMDILVVLLLFLLKSFVVEGEAMTPAPGVELPHSTSLDPPEESLVVAVDGNSILVGGEPVATLHGMVPEDPLLIAPLARRLQSLRHRSEEIALRQGAAEETRRPATVQADRDLPFHVLERVMFTLSESGYPDVSLAVIKRS